jgi:hypothetical protein
VSNKTDTIGGLDIFELNISVAPIDLMSLEVPVIDKHEFLTEALAWNIPTMSRTFSGHRNISSILRMLTKNI